MAHAAELFGQAEDYDETLRKVARAAVPDVADWCGVELVLEGGSTEQLAVAHVDPEKVAFARRLRERHPPDPDAPNGVPAVLRTGRSELVPQIPDELIEAAAKDEEHLRLIRSLGLRSYMVVPMRVRGRVVGAITLVAAESGRIYGQNDLLVAESLAELAALALDNAALMRDVRAREHRYRQILDSVQDLVSVRDPQRGLTYANRATCRFHGRSEAELAEGGPGARPEDTRVIEEGAVVEVAEEVEESGPAPRYFHTVRSPLRDPHGKVVEVVEVARDVTDLKLAREAQAHLEREKRATRFAGLRAELSAHLATRGSDDALRSCCEALVGRTEATSVVLWRVRGDELVCAGVYPTAHLDPVAAPPAAVTVLHSRLPKVWTRRSEDRPDGLFGSAGPVQVLLPVVGTKPLGVLALTGTAPPGDDLQALVLVAEVLAHGIERAEAQAALARYAEELERSNAELNQFAYVASHDLQEPLRMVASYVQLLKRRYAGRLDADADDFIGYAVDGANRMQALINDLLAYSRVGTKRRAFAPVDLGETLDVVRANLQVAILESGAEITSDRLPTVLGDEIQLVQLLQNLIGNAIKFRGAEAPRVHVSAVERGGMHQIALRDNGIGVSPEFFDRVFVIFQRLHTRDVYGGNGIGLAICRKIVERHDGRIWLESEPGHGATFTFTLPVPPENR